MTIKIVRVAFCDGDKCEIYDITTNNTLRPKNGGHWCVKHYPYEHCGMCKRKLRPYQAKLVDWPGTAAKHSTHPLRCTGCWARMKFKPEDQEHFPIPAEEVAAVKKLVVVNVKDDESLDDIFNALGLE